MFYGHNYLNELILQTYPFRNQLSLLSTHSKMGSENGTNSFKDVKISKLKESHKNTWSQHSIIRNPRAHHVQVRRMVKNIRDF